MAVFEPDIDPSNETAAAAVNGSSVRTNTPDTTLSSTVWNTIDSHGISRSPQPDHLAANLGTGSIAPFQGGTAVGAYASAPAVGCTALGYYALAKVSRSCALGDQASATAYRAIAIGAFANATGVDSIAIGSYAFASAVRSIALGNQSKASGANSFAIGSYTTASGSGSTALGMSSTASATNATALGEGSTASGTDSTAVGGSAVASADRSVAIGFNSQSSHAASLAIAGQGAVTTAANQLSGGSQDYPLNDVYFGKGPSANALGDGSLPTGWTAHGDEASGSTNAIGGDLNLAGGRGTGTGKAGSVRIQVANALGTGSTLGMLYDRIVTASRKTLTNNTTTEIFRIAVPNPSAVAFQVVIGISVSDGTNTQSYSATASVAALHDAGGYSSTITTVGAATQLGAGGSTLAVTISMTQPATDIMAFNLKSNTGVITPTSILAFVRIDVSGETTVTLV